MSHPNIVTLMMLCIMTLLFSESALAETVQPDQTEFTIDVEDGNDNLVTIILPDLESPEEPGSSVDPLAIEVDGDDGTNTSSSDPVDFGGDQGDIVVEVETVPLPPTLGMLFVGASVLALYTRRIRA